MYGTQLEKQNVFIIHIPLWIPEYSRSAKSYLHQFYMDTGCNKEDLPVAMDDRDELFSSVVLFFIPFSISKSLGINKFVLYRGKEKIHSEIELIVY